MNIEVINEVTKNIFYIIKLESKMIGLLEAVKKIHQVAEESKITGEPLYKPRTIVKEDDTPVLIYEGSDIYELDYATYLIRTLILDYISAIEELKDKNYQLTGKDHYELLADSEFITDDFRRRSVQEIELDKKLDEIKYINEMETVYGKSVFEKIDKQFNDEERKLGWIDNTNFSRESENYSKGEIRYYKRLKGVDDPKVFRDWWKIKKIV